MFAPKNTKLVDLLQEKIGCKRKSCRTYASQLRKLWRTLGRDPDSMPPDFKWLDTPGVVKFVKKIDGLVQRKNMTTAVISGLRTLDEPKQRHKFQEMLKLADDAYKQFLSSNQRRRPYKSAFNEWEKIKELPQRALKVLNAHKLWKRGDLVSYPEYALLMTTVYLHWVVYHPPRRLQAYALSRLITPEDYDELEEKNENYVIMHTGRKRWEWKLHVYKTVKHHSVQSFPLNGRLQKLLKRAKPIIFAKNSRGRIFLKKGWAGMTSTGFSKFVKSVFVGAMNKPWTQNTIRSIFVSKTYKDTPQTLELLKIAEGMGHTVEAALVNYR